MFACFYLSLQESIHLHFSIKTFFVHMSTFAAFNGGVCVLSVRHYLHVRLFKSVCLIFGASPGTGTVTTSLRGVLSSVQAT